MRRRNGTNCVGETTRQFKIRSKKKDAKHPTSVKPKEPREQACTCPKPNGWRLSCPVHGTSETSETS